MGRAEAYAMQNGPAMSALDGFGNGLGYSLILIIVGSIRELIGSGQLLGYQILQMTTEGVVYSKQFLFVTSCIFFNNWSFYLGIKILEKRTNRSS